MPNMSGPAKQPNVTKQLDALYEQVGPEAPCLCLAQVLAEADRLFARGWLPPSNTRSQGRSRHSIR